MHTHIYTHTHTHLIMLAVSLLYYTGSYSKLFQAMRSRVMSEISITCWWLWIKPMDSFLINGFLSFTLLISRMGLSDSAVASRPTVQKLWFLNAECVVSLAEVAWFSSSGFSRVGMVWSAWQRLAVLGLVGWQWCGQPGRGWMVLGLSSVHHDPC